MTSHPRSRYAPPPPPGLLDLIARLAERGLSDHGRAVAALAGRVARGLPEAAPRAARIELAALLHDVGKVELAPSLLDHPGALSPQAWDLMRTHPVRGEQLALVVPGLEPIARLLRHHHERWDGQGYPDGLAGQAIPLGARIIHVCDAFDAMTQPRCYRTTRTVVEACAELERCAGRQFDPVVARVAVDTILHTVHT
jgi:HD-GYP domain-containing protein (c-di-GMP phosphodiesterase class II)